jgi:translocation and assembly module TamA
MRLIARGEIGRIDADDFDQLPPELRFFSGGDRSIRGFGFEEIGSRNAAGDVIGGDHLVEASLEVERYWRKNLGAAVFVDAGDAFLGDDFSLHVGAGAGLRWKSPVGVLRLDLAYPVKSVDSSSWQIHFNIGPDF